ncbi:MAG: YlxM family DNA-binding protein [Syntrophomonadaceae bacterium]|jgi:predicted DNA-binding protein YlxM (UPF0122 family)
MLEKISHMVMLKDFYGPLLTDKQQLVLSLYYEEDLSLSEIADNMNITRQAVYDLLKRAESALEDYEKRLQLVDKFNKNRQRLNEVYRILDHHQSDAQDIARAINILREITEMV